MNYYILDYKMFLLYKMENVDFVTFNFSGISPGETRTKTPIECSNKHFLQTGERNIAGCYNPNFICVSRKKVGDSDLGRWSPGATVEGVQIPNYVYLEHYIGATRSWEQGYKFPRESLQNWKTPYSKATKDNLRAWSPCSLGCVFRTGYEEHTDFDAGRYWLRDTIRYIDFIVFKDAADKILPVENSNKMGFCIDKHIKGRNWDKPTLKLPIGLRPDLGQGQDENRIIFKGVGVTLEDPRIWKLNNNSIGILANWSWQLDRGGGIGGIDDLELQNFLKIFAWNSLPVMEQGNIHFSTDDKGKCSIIYTKDRASISDTGGVDKGPTPVWSRIPFDFEAERDKSIGEVLDTFEADWKSDKYDIVLRDFELLCSSFLSYGKQATDRGVDCAPGDKNWAILPSSEDNRIDILRGIGAYGTRPNKIYSHTFNTEAGFDEPANISCSLTDVRSTSPNTNVSTTLDESLAWVQSCAFERPVENCDNNDVRRVQRSGEINWPYGILRDDQNKNGWKQRFNSAVDNNPLRVLGDFLKNIEHCFGPVSVGGPLCNIIDSDTPDEKLGILHLKVEGKRIAAARRAPAAAIHQLHKLFSNITNEYRTWPALAERSDRDKQLANYIPNWPGTEYHNEKWIGIDYDDIKSYEYPTSYLTMVFKYDYKSMVLKQISYPFFINSYGASSGKRDTWLQFASQIINCGEGSKKYCISYGEDDAMAKMAFIPKDTLHNYLRGKDGNYPVLITDDHGVTTAAANDPAVWEQWINNVHILTPFGFESLDAILDNWQPRGLDAAHFARIRDSNNFLTCYGPGGGEAEESKVEEDRALRRNYWFGEEATGRLEEESKAEGVTTFLPFRYRGHYQTSFGPITLNEDGGLYEDVGGTLTFKRVNSLYESYTLVGEFTNPVARRVGVFAFTWSGGETKMFEGEWNWKEDLSVQPTPWNGFNFLGTYNTNHGDVVLGVEEGSFAPVGSRDWGKIEYISTHFAPEGNPFVTLEGEYYNPEVREWGEFTFKWNNPNEFNGTWSLRGTGAGGRGGSWDGRRSQPFGGGAKTSEISPKDKIEVKNLVNKGPKTKLTKATTMQDLKLLPGAGERDQVPLTEEQRKKILMKDFDPMENRYGPPPPFPKSLLDKNLKLDKKYLDGGMDISWFSGVYWYTVSVAHPKEDMNAVMRRDWAEGVKRGYTLAEFVLWISTKYNTSTPWDNTKYAILFNDVSIGEGANDSQRSITTVSDKEDEHATFKKFFNPNRISLPRTAAAAAGGSKRKYKRKKRKKRTRRKNKNHGRKKTNRRLKRARKKYTRRKYHKSR